MNDNNYFHCWLLPINVLQYMTPYDGLSIGNSLKFMLLDNILNRDIFHILRFHCFLSRFVRYGEVTEEEESNMHFFFSTLKEISKGLKRIWESKLRTFSSARIIQYVDLTLKTLEMIYC